MSTASHLPVASTRETFRATLDLARAQRGLGISTLCILGAGVAVGLLGPWLVGEMVDTISGDGSATRFWTLAGCLAVSVAISTGLGWFGRVLLAGVVQRAVRTLRDVVFTRAFAQSSTRLEAAGTGDLVSRLSGDVTAVTTVVSTTLPTFLTALLTTALSLVGMALLDPRLAAAALLAAPVQYLSLRRFLRQSGPVYRQHRAAQAERAQHLIETVRGRDTIRALGTGDQRLTQLGATSEQVITLEMRATHLRNVFYGWLNTAELIGLSAVLVAGFWLLRTDVITLGAATAAALYFMGLFGPIGALLASVDELQDAGASLARLVGISSLPAPANLHLEHANLGSDELDRYSPHSTEVRRQATGAIDLRLVNFGHRSGSGDLADVTLTIAPGQRVAVVGTSGAGKTTLAKVIAGLLVPDSGEVRLDGRLLSEWRPSDLRAAVAMVSQESHVFTGSVRNDLLLFAPHVTDDRLAAVIKDLGARWLLDLPDGLDTRIGSGAHLLTPGQAQHLALLRLALTDSPVVILDEATAEAGSAEADALDQAADRATEGRTSIVIAHRMSQVVGADRILTMADGRVVEDGTHDQLVAGGGLYARLWRAWTA